MAKMEKSVINSKEFNFHTVEKTSYATKYLFLWVQAMVNFYYKWKETEPVR